MRLSAKCLYMVFFLSIGTIYSVLWKKQWIFKAKKMILEKAF